MSFNRIQFQPGMSLPEFHRHFGTEAHCATVLKGARWPGGFRCPRCDSHAHCVVGHGARRLFQCNGCRHQASLTAGSLMAHTKLPLTPWFLAIDLISPAKTGLSALALKRQLGVSYPTAWLLHHKINRAMAASDAGHRLEGEVRNLTVSQSGGKSFASIQTQREVEQPLSTATTAIGIDVGIARFARFATFSDADFVAPLNRASRNTSNALRATSAA